MEAPHGPEIIALAQRVVWLSTWGMPAIIVALALLLGFLLTRYWPALIVGLFIEALGLGSLVYARRLGRQIDKLYAARR